LARATAPIRPRPNTKRRGKQRLCGLRLDRLRALKRERVHPPRLLASRRGRARQEHVDQLKQQPADSLKRTQRHVRLQAAPGAQPPRLSARPVRRRARRRLEHKLDRATLARFVRAQRCQQLAGRVNTMIDPQRQEPRAAGSETRHPHVLAHLGRRPEPDRLDSDAAEALLHSRADLRHRHTTRDEQDALRAILRR
jgi:hypothetical protein